MPMETAINAGVRPVDRPQTAGKADGVLVRIVAVRRQPLCRKPMWLLKLLSAIWLEF